MKRYIALAGIAASLLVCEGASGAPPFSSSAPAATPPAHTAQLALLGPLKKVGLSLIVKVGGKFAKHLFDKWVSSGFTNCSPPIPKFLCSSKVRPSPHRIMWGVGIANSIQGRSPGVWTRPTSPRLPVGSLTPGSPYYLTCWTLGDLSGGSSLWYRLPSGGYVADVWLFTGTDNVIPGVQHC